MGVPPARSASRTSPTVACPRFWRHNAHAPATWGVAIEVPLRVAKDWTGTAETIRLPGASRSRKSAEFENEETWLCLVTEPTLTAEERQPGAARASI